MADLLIGERLYTVEELMALGSDERVEVIEGEIVEMSPVGGLHHFIAGNIYDELRAFTRKHDLGFVFMDGLLYLLYKEGKGIRGAQVPDVSFIRGVDIITTWQMEQPYPGAPTLAVEVMSPDDKIEEVLLRVRRYLNAGSEQVWLVFPRERELHQYFRESRAQVQVNQIDDALDGGTLLPDFTLRMRDVFVVPKLS